MKIEATYGYTDIHVSFTNDNSLGFTILPMMSDDYKDRFRAEYNQLTIRIGKLTDILLKDSNGTLPFTLSCSRYLLVNQLSAMKDYKKTLELRAIEEGIDIYG